MSIEQAIDTLLEMPDEPKEERDNALVAAMAQILENHINPFALIVSLTVSYLMAQPDRYRMYTHYINYLTSSWLSFEQHQSEVDKAMAESQEIGFIN